MKSIYESSRLILEQNKLSRNDRSLPPLEGQGGGGTFTGFGSSTNTKAALYPSAGGRSSAFKAAEKIEKEIKQPNTVNPPSTPKQTSNELPSVKSSKGLGVDLYTSPAPVVKKGPTGSEKIPPDAAVPTYIRQNKPDPVLTDKSTVDKSSKDKKAIDLMVRMDQMQKQGIGQTKPKVSSDFYKNLKATGMKPSNESRMSSTYLAIRRILGEKHHNYDELKEYQDIKDILAEGPPKVGELIDIKAKQQDSNKPLSAITTGSLGNRIDVKRVDLEKDVSRGSQTKYITSRAIKGNADMKKKEAEAARKAAAAKAASNPASVSTPAAAPQPTVSREAEKSGPDLNAMKKNVAANQKYDEIDPVAATKDNADSKTPVESPASKPQANQGSDNKFPDIVAPGSSTQKFRDPTEPSNPMPGIFHPKSLGDKRQVRDNSDGVDPVTGKPLDNKPGTSSVQVDQPKTNPEPKPQAAAVAEKPASSEFKFSADQEKFLGKANRQDPYIINRMPGDKPSADYYKDPKDQELAKKINTGNETVKKIKGAIGMKESTINKKFDITDALYQSVMEVMKKDKGSVPRNKKEKDLAAHYGDPKVITHGDILTARGVTQEEAEQQDEGMLDTVKAKVLPILTGGSDKDLLKKLQKDMGVPQTGQKPSTPVKENKDTPGNGYAHQCAVHVKSESFGEGRTITTQHASPDADGNIEWYDVMFEHGIERYVPTSTLEILVSEMHMHSKKKKM